MKTRAFIIFSAITVFSLQSLLAQVSVYDGGVKVYQKDIREANGKVEIDLSFDYSALELPSKETLTLIPVLKDDAGSKVALPAIHLNGNNRQKVYDRKVSLNEEQPIFDAAYKIVRAKDKGQNPIEYSASVPAEAWMKNARLYIQANKCGCADSQNLLSETEVGKIRFRPDERYRPDVHVAFTVPKTEAVKNRNEVGEAYLDFHVGKYNIIPDFRNNAAELDKINNLINQVVTDDNITVNAIVFTGKASPEGSFDSNMKLSQNRAKALLDYANKINKLDSDLLRAQSVGEDWEGFEALMVASDYKEKDALLEIIRSSDQPDVKERKFRALNNGAVFTYLNSTIFPQLRRVECKLEYTVRAFSVEEGKEIIKTRPQQLSLNEMYLVANTYRKGSDEFNQVFDVAARIYPQDPVANSNAAAIALSRGDANAAQSYLNKSENSPENENNRGVLYLIQGDLNNAETYLKRAQANGVKEASANLDELEKKRADNKLFDSFEN